MSDEIMSTQSDDRSFMVPYRCLIPPDAVGIIIGKGAVILRSLVHSTGIEVQVLRSEENPRGLDDRMVILNGSQKSKSKALSWLLQKLRDHFRKRPDDLMTFVALVPAVATASIIGNRGASIREISHRSRAEIDISKERVRGTSDNAVTIKGKLDEIHTAMTLIDRMLVVLRDKGELAKRDFTFCKIFPSGGRMSASESQDKHINTDVVPNVPIRVVVSADEVDYLTTRDGALEEVKDLEREFKCLVTVEEPAIPLMEPNQELMVVSGTEQRDKAEVVAAIVQKLNKRNPNRFCGFLVEVGAVDHGSHFKLRGQDEKVKFIECICSDLTSQLEAILRLCGLGKVDCATPRDPQTRRLIVSLASANDEHLDSLRTRSNCNIQRISSDSIELNGSKAEILRAVETLLDIEPVTANMDDSRRRRIPSDEDDMVDYGY